MSVMPRKPRINLPGVPQHIVQRGNNREPCFYTEADYCRYMDYLGTALHRNRCRLHAYVLMTNHVHLLITPAQEFGISCVMQDTGRKYVQYINRTCRRTGTLWEGRYKASLVDSDAWLLTCMRYIEMNPVRAGMVAHPRSYHWSSYAANARGQVNPVLSPHPLYLGLGDVMNERLYAYRELFRHHLDDRQLHELRNTLNQGLVLGREDFKDVIERMTQRQVRRGKDGRPRAEETPAAYEPGGGAVEY
jgi:putative transposase